MKFESDTENDIIPLIIFHSFGNYYNQFINFLPIFLFQNAHNLSIFSIYGDAWHWFLEIFRILVQIEKVLVDVSTIRLIPSLRSIGQKVQNVLVNKFMRILALCVFARGSRVINARKSVFRNGRPTVSRGAACNSGSVAVQTVLPLTIVARDRPSLIDTGNYWFQPLLDRSPIFWSASFHHSASHSDDVQVISPHPYEYSSAPCPSAKCLIIRFTLGGA